MMEVKLNDGNMIPAVGFGVFLIPNDGSTYKAVREALDAGYRQIDTAAAYFNEQEVGNAVRESGIPRDEIFITSKLWIQDYGYDAAKKGIEASLRNLDCGWIDLYLLHQPYFDVTGAWQALEEAKGEGKLKSIGVSNMTPALWQKYVSQFKTIPAVTQVECNPFCQQRELRKILEPLDVRIEAYFPLGHGDKKLLENPLINSLAKKYNKNPGQIILRFEVQDGLIVLPKSTNPQRIVANIGIFDFQLTSEEMEAMRKLDTGHVTYNPETPGMGDALLQKFHIHD